MSFLVLWAPVALARVSPAGPAHVIVKMGDHDHFGRVVFRVPQGVTATLEPHGDSVNVLLPGAGAVPGAKHGPRNVAAIEGGADGAVLVLTPGSSPVLWQDGTMVVVDVFRATVVAPADMAARRPFRARAEAEPTKIAAVAPVSVAAAPVAVPAAPVAVPAAIVAVPAARAGGAARAASAAGAVVGAPAKADATEGGAGANDHASIAGAGQSVGADPSRTVPGEPVAPDGLVAVRAPVAPGEDAAMLVPFESGVGAASFPRGGGAHVIFDESKPVDMAALKDDPVFGAAHVTLLPAATHLAMKLHTGQMVRLRRRPEGWVVAVGTAGRAEASAAVRMGDGVVVIDTPQAAETIVDDDPATGGRLLVGTVRGEGPGVAVGHRSPEFAVLPSWAGVLVAAQSDRLSLRSGKEGFVVSAATGPKLAAAVAGDSAQALADAGTLTRRFDFGPLPVEVRRVQLQRELADAAGAPKLARFTPRLRAAQQMLALGMDREAAASLRVAVRDDPAQAGNVDAASLLAMADWLGGAAGDGAALAAPALGNSDEVALWRAVVHPVPLQQAAAALADRWRLLLAYSEALRRRLMPVVADILVRGGQPAAAEAFMALAGDPALDAARALALHQAGKIDAALALADRLSRARDRRVAAQAVRDGVEWRLAAGRIAPGAAADMLERHLDDWHDDAADAEAALHIADLRAKAGSWRAALQGLRGVEASFPEARERARAAERSVIEGLLRPDWAGKIAPLDLVALVEDNADLLAGEQASATIAPVLADKLMALDLPDRAAPILSRLMQATTAVEPRAGLGARLASLRLDQGDAAGARAALAASDAAGLSAGLAEHRVVLLARTLLLEGNEDKALALLTALSGSEALELRARLLEARHDWRGATAALQALVASSLPAEGKLADAQQDLVLRLASAASQAGDAALMEQLRVGDATRLAAGPRAELFRALATRPVQSVADLPRAAAEVHQVLTVPAALASYAPR